jgi:hypothetical protein
MSVIAPANEVAIALKSASLIPPMGTVDGM